MHKIIYECINRTSVRLCVNYKKYKCECNYSYIVKKLRRNNYEEKRKKISKIFKLN